MSIPTSSALTNTWTCSSGLNCNYKCNTQSYQKMWDGLTSTREYSYSFTAPQASKYTCNVTIRTSSFGNSEANEVTDIYINDNLFDSTPDECCPEDCGAETLANPFEFTLNPAFTDTTGGGVFVHDLDSDGLFDFVFTSGNAGQAGWLAAYDHWGNKLWSKTGVKMFSYLHHPSAIAGDMDGDGKQEVAYLTPSDEIKIVDGTTGVEKKTVSTGASLNGQPVAGMGIVNLRGAGDRDVVVQYRRPSHYSKDPLKAINLETGAVLWTNNNYIGTEHSIFRQADMEGDGKDEIAGVILLDDNGNKMHSWNLGDYDVDIYGIDSMVIADIYWPGVPYPDAPCPGKCISDYFSCTYYDNCQDSSGKCPSGQHCCEGACTEPVYNPPSKPEILSAPAECDINTLCGPFRVRSTVNRGDIRYFACRHEYPGDSCWGDLTNFQSGEIAEIYTVYSWRAPYKFGTTILAEGAGGQTESDPHQIQIKDNMGNTQPNQPVFVVSPPTTCVKSQPCGPFRVRSTDPNNDDIVYLFRWDDGDWTWAPAIPTYQSDPSGTIEERYHTYQQTGSYEVKIRAIDVNYGTNPYGYNVKLMAYSTLLSTTVTVTDAGASGESETEADKISLASPTNPLEVALAETAGKDSRTIVVNKDRIALAELNPYTQMDANKYDDCDKLAVGDFRTNQAGLEIFCRSSASDGTCTRNSKTDEMCPWVHSSQGNVLNWYYIEQAPNKPAWLDIEGIEEMVRIDWDGDARDEIVAKKRHVDGPVAILDAVTGTFEKTWDNVEAMRVYAADILGDYREEVIVVDANGGQYNKVKIFWNNAANTNSKPRYWTLQHYARQKQNWNYYSP